VGAEVVIVLTLPGAISSTIEVTSAIRKWIREREREEKIIT